MGARGKVAQLPEALRDELNQRLIDGGFSNFTGLESWLADQGYAIGKSSIQRYACGDPSRPGDDGGLRGLYQRSMERGRMMAEQRKLYAAGAADEDDGERLRVRVMSAGDNIEMLNLRLTELLDRGVEDTGELMDVAKVAAALTRSLSDLGRLDLSAQKYREQVVEKARAAAVSVEKIAKKGGLSGDAVDAIRREILGISG